MNVSNEEKEAVEQYYRNPLAHIEPRYHALWNELHPTGITGFKISRAKRFYDDCE